MYTYKLSCSSKVTFQRANRSGLDFFMKPTCKEKEKRFFYRALDPHSFLRINYLTKLEQCLTCVPVAVFGPLLRLSPPPSDKDYCFNLDDSEGVCDLFDVLQHLQPWTSRIIFILFLSPNEQDNVQISLIVFFTEICPVCHIQTLWYKIRFFQINFKLTTF